MTEDKRELISASKVLIEVNGETSKQQYSKLIHVIEFFSQRFSLDNMTQYMYDFVMELLEPTRCSMVILDHKVYKLYATNMNFEKVIEFKKEEKHDRLVYFHPGILDKDFLRGFLEADIFRRIQPEIGIPIIIDKTLYGIVFIRKEEVISEDELIIAEALMNLYHLALTNLKNYDYLELVKRELDEKIFNLFAINQASKALLSEQDPNRLMYLSLSVFSELTQSCVTSIFLKDTMDSSYHLVDYNDVVKAKRKVNIRLYPCDITKMKIKSVVDWNDKLEKESFVSLFRENVELLEQFNPHYIVNFVNNNDLVGFVTISNRVTGDKYDRGVFELLDSLASATYVAISNANNYFEVLKHKKLAEDKFSRISTLNRLIKNMNSASDLHNLVELTLDTLKIAFGYKTSFYASYNTDSFNIEAQINVDFASTHFRIDMILDTLLEGHYVIEYDHERIQEVLNDIMTDNLSQNIQSMIMIPVFIEDIELKLFGVICLLDVDEGVISTAENIVTLETIANLVAPIIGQFNTIAAIKTSYQVDECRKFINYCEQLMEEALQSAGEFYVVIIRANSLHLFRTADHWPNKELSLPAYQLDMNHKGFVSYSINKVRDVLTAFDDHKKLLLGYPKDFNDLHSLKSAIEQFIFL